MTPADCEAQPAAPAAREWPRPGELFYVQLGLGGLSLGEAALVVGPDGAVTALDVGNDSHDDDVADALEALRAHLPGRPAATLDHVVLTHFHADHADGLSDLLATHALTGRVVHRGFTDVTAAANEATIQRVCEVVKDRPGSSLELCEAAPMPCDRSQWTGTHPSTGCPGLGTRLPLGAGAELRFAGANGAMAGERFDDVVGPLNAADSNGENARSVVAVLSHGAFRMLVAGDLTGGGSDTNDVEGFFAARLAGATGLGELGVDVLHAGHHGRDTSSSTAWLDALLPRDGRSRNVVMGISTAHLGSPHASVLGALLGEARLGQGRAFTTRISSGGASAEGLVNAAGGQVIVATRDGGDWYVVQAVDGGGKVLDSRAYRAIRCAR